MGYSNGRISAPVGIYDIQRALGLSSPDEGTLFVSEKINMFARYKPQRMDGPKFMYYNRRSAYISEDMSKFGLRIPFCRLDVMNAKIYNILDDIESDEGWLYLRPRGDRTPQGGVQEFFRLSDFARILTDDTDPYYGTAYAPGYNHNAKLPFMAIVDSSGMSEREDSSQLIGKYYEINLQVVNSIKITFYNSIGDDLHLQDFIDIRDYGNNVRWRPVIQVFNGYQQAGALPWYQRPQADVEIAGDAITIAQDGTWSVVLPLNTSYFEPYINVNNTFHLCIGVGCVNPDFSAWKDNNESLFILPYTDEMNRENNLPFYYAFKLVSYQARRINVQQLQFYQGGLERWEIAGGTPPSFIINSLSRQQIRVTFTISKLLGQALDFISQNGSPDVGYDPLRIQMREMITGNPTEVIKYLTPTDSSWHQVNHSHVPAAQTQEEVGQPFTLYGIFDIGNGVPPLSIGSYGEYHIYANTGSTQWDNIGYMSIYMEEYHN